MNQRVLLISLSGLALFLVIWMVILTIQISRLPTANPQTLAAANPPSPTNVEAQTPLTQPEDAGESVVQTTTEKLRVALISPSAITDLAWSQSMFDSLLEVQQELGGEQAMEIAISPELFRVPEAIPIIRDYAAQGYDLIITHGTQYGEPLFDIAPDYPNTTFAWGPAHDTRGLSNVFVYDAPPKEGGYVNGVIAALLSQSDVIGIVGSVDVHHVSEYHEGFTAGVKATAPSTEILVEYTGSFSDVTLAAQVASRQIEAGADILTGMGQQVVGAISMAKQSDVLWLGAQSDQSVLAPELVVAAIVYDWSDIIQEIIALRRQGTLGGRVYKASLANGGVRVKFNQARIVPDDLQAAATNAIEGIIDGQIQP